MGTRKTSGTEAQDEAAEPAKPIERLASAEETIEDLKAQVAQLTELITRPRPNGPMIGVEELKRTLSNDPQVRPEGGGAINPHSKKPYFNELRPTGKH